MSGVDKDFFSINSSSGELSFISAPSFANPIDTNKDNVYEVTLKVQNIDDTSKTYQLYHLENPFLF